MATPKVLTREQLRDEIIAGSYRLNLLLKMAHEQGLRATVDVLDEKGYSRVVVATE